MLNLLNQLTCYVVVYNYKQVEGYWNYELCHGLHIRQFHEDRSEDGKV